MRRPRLSRRILLLQMLVAIGVFSVCEALILVGTHRALEAALDGEITARASALAVLLEAEDDVIELENEGDALREYGGAHPSAVFRIFQVTTGLEIASAPSESDAPWPPLPAAPTAIASGETLRWDAHWQGRPMRFAAGRYEAHLEWLERPRDNDVAPLDCIIVVGRDRSDTDARYASVRRVTLLALGGGLLITLLLSLPALRWGLSPLRRLRHDVQSLSPERLEPVPVPDVAEAAELAATLNGFIVALRSTLERERRFMADVAHELRTPVSEVHTLAEVALRGLPAGDPRRVDYEDVLAATTRMAGIVRTLLTLARFESGSEAPQREPVALGSLVAATWASLRDRAADRQLAAKLPEGDGPTVEADPEMLRTLVSNVLDNAVAYAPAGSRIDVELVERDGRFALTVANDPGELDASDVSHLFERFWRKDASRAAGHSGLGLSLALALAEALGFALTAKLERKDWLAVRLEGAVVG